MAIVNTAPVADVRKVISGKDAGFYNEAGKLLATIESFTSQVAVNNTTYRPLGTAQEHAGMTSYRVTLSVTQIVVEDDDLFVEFMEGLKNHRMPVWNFRGMANSPYNESGQQIIYRDCVPDGTIDLQNLTPDDLYKRTWNFVVNQPPELQELLKY